MGAHRRVSCFRFKSLSIAFAAALFAPPLALAEELRLFTVTNFTGVAASDLHITFAGAGGAVSVDSLAVIAPGCPPPAVTPSPDDVTIDWGSACVPPGASVSFLAYTPNGPLSITDGFWTTDDAPSGPVGPTEDREAPAPDPAMPFGAIKIIGYYKPLGTPWWWYWSFNPDQICRFCCYPGAECWYRVLYCPFNSRISRFFELPVWIPLTPWVRGPDLPPRYYLRYFLSWAMFGQLPPPPPGLPPHQPPNWPWAAWEFNLDVRYSDDLAGAWRPAADFTSAFYEISAAMNFGDPNAPMVTTRPELLMEFGPRYAAAADAILRLVAEADEVLVFEPDPDMMQTRADLNSLQQSIRVLSAHFNMGAIGAPIHFATAANALNALAARIPLMTGSPRLQNAAEDMQRLAEQFSLAGAMATGGLNSELEEVCYRDAVLSRIPAHVKFLAGSMSPHMRIQVDLGDYQWQGSSVEGVAVRVQSAATGQVLDELLLPVSDLLYLDVPLIHALDEPLRLELKTPTHLSAVLELFAQDGARVGPIPLVQGDANGDNCVDLNDLNMVLNDQGQGGIGSTYVPSSDVNGDGFVDGADIQIVQDNVGQCGQTLPTSCAGDVDRDGDVDLTDVSLLLAQFGQSGGGLSADLDGDGDVDLTDLSIQLAAYGAVCA
jgi:hypothetical protein